MHLCCAAFHTCPRLMLRTVWYDSWSSQCEMPCGGGRPASVIWANFMLQFSGRHERACALMQPYRIRAHRWNVNDFSLAQWHIQHPLWLHSMHSSVDDSCSVEGPRLGDFIYKKIFLCVSSRPWASKEAPSAISHSACCSFLLTFPSVCFSFLFFFLYLGRPSLQGPKLMSCSGATVALCSCNCGSLSRSPCHITVIALLNSDHSFINDWYKHALP